MTITVGLSAVKTGFDLIKSVRELLTRPKVDAGEISARLQELQDLMLDARTALADAAEEKSNFEAKIIELTRMADFGKDFELEEGVYWRDKVPYCPICWDVQRKPVRLSGPDNFPTGFVGTMNWSCSIHKANFPISRNKSDLTTS